VLNGSPALLLVDLQQDYLASTGLEPHAAALCAKAAQLLQGFRARSLPVAHVWTTVHEAGERMPHWRDAGVERCMEGSLGHRTPPALVPRAQELVLHKRFYSAFTTVELLPFLRRTGVDTLVLAGVHLRACIRATAVDAYQHGFSVVVTDDAVGDDDPVHAAVSRQYLERRFVRFLSVDQILASGTDARPRAPAFAERRVPELPAAIVAGVEVQTTGSASELMLSPCNGRTETFAVSFADERTLEAAADACDASLQPWQQRPLNERRSLFSRMAEALSADGESFAQQIMREVGKPIADARGEVGFALALVRAAVAASIQPSLAIVGNDWQAVRRPHGVIAIVTPWNNPLAIALGKIVPALLYGNAVVWKPAPQGAAVAARCLRMLMALGLPEGIVNLVNGDRREAERLISLPGIAAVAITGSTAAGTGAQVIAATRRIPFQAEMGGNNAVVVWADADLARAAALISTGAFGSAGQRCTATRRIIVDQRCFDAFLELLQAEVAAMRWGDPADDRTRIGPVVSAAARSRLEALFERALDAGFRSVRPLQRPQVPLSMDNGYWFPPTLVFADAPDAEIVRSETFGPLVAVQRAASWEHAIELCNAVPQGLVASLFSRTEAMQADFLQRACAGILKVNAATAGVSAEAPFCGWKDSGSGPPEHGVGDLEFYTRWQTVYREA